MTTTAGAERFACGLALLAFAASGRPSGQPAASHSELGSESLRGQGRLCLRARNHARARQGRHGPFTIRLKTSPMRKFS